MTRVQYPSKDWVEIRSYKLSLNEKTVQSQFWMFHFDGPVKSRHFPMNPDVSGQAKAGTHFFSLIIILYMAIPSRNKSIHHFSVSISTAGLV